MARRNTVTPFSRDYRRPPKWGMGLPPRRPRRGTRRARLGLVAVLVLLLGPRAGDVVNAGVTATDGCRIYGIVDGDTVRMHCPGSGRGATRLTGFDTPEFDAACPRELVMAYLATQALRLELWRAGAIAVAERGRDRYGRRLARVEVDGVPLARRMVDTGFARAYDGGARPGWCG
jgi:endonuclease YncB( thermonuclease family)